MMMSQIWSRVTFRPRNSSEMIVTVAADGTVLDAHVEGQYGGTGEGVNLALAAEFCHRDKGSFPILAGGLRPGNVAAAIQAVRPYAVDVSSGIESAPGIKDSGKMEAFVRQVYSADPPKFLK